MEWLNYHHLYYFWNVAREGSIARACKRLNLAQPTISGQLRALEESLGQVLFNRVGRGLVLTPTGRTVYRYADEIFSLGRELMGTLRDRPTGRPLQLTVGVADALPKLIAYHILEAALALEPPAQITCIEGKADSLLAEMAVHGLDLVLSDAPIGSSARIRAFNHALGECGNTLFGVPELVRSRRSIPEDLDGAPFLLPTYNTTLRRSIDQWFDERQIRPHIVGEFEDSALLKVFGQSGRGLFFAPSVIEAEVCRQYGVEAIGRMESIQERFYAISPERRIKHPAVVAIVENARRGLFVGLSPRS